MQKRTRVSLKTTCWKNPDTVRTQIRNTARRQHNNADSVENAHAEREKCTVGAEVNVKSKMATFGFLMVTLVYLNGTIVNSCD